MMSLIDLPLSFWGYALVTAAFTFNKAPSKSVETTPYELWFSKKPKLSVGGWVRHMPKDGLSWWERVERRWCPKAG